MDRVRLGIVGIGNIAPINARGYLEDERCDVVALCDRREEKARRTAQEWGVPRVYTELGDLLADPEIDAVEILTPTHMHRDHVLAAAAAGPGDDLRVRRRGRDLPSERVRAPLPTAREGPRADR
jgi:predicted dehydrogenase